MTHCSAARTAAVLGLLAVALGAFGAHSLKDLLARNETAAIWEKAVFYHFIHALMLFILAGRSSFQKGPWLAFLLGILLFSGSLYLFAVTRMHWLVFVTPVGGVSFLVGWLWLAICPRTTASVPDQASPPALPHPKGD